MTSLPSDRPVSALRARMIEDMNVRGFSEKTRNDYIRNVRAFAAFVGRSPDTATAEDLRRFQHHQAQTGLRPPSINGAVAALRFFFTVTLDRPDLARRLTVVREPRRLPAALMAADLASTPKSGLTVQACGDAHLMNFGGFATPEQNIIFDINDLDETLPAPWEWDLKRLVASVVIAARHIGLSESDTGRTAIDTVREYREGMSNYGSMRVLDVWYVRLPSSGFSRK
jgi:hypothetical protein